MDNKLLVICGPTATGKTALAITLAKKFNGELVSADSRQIYKGMDIGTGKDIGKNAKCQMPNAKFSFKNEIYRIPLYDIDGVNVWMYNVVEPDEEFSVAHYQHLATAVIEDIRKRGKLPIVVGGTGLYIKSLLSPIETSHIPPNKQLRKTLEQYSIEDLQKRLQKEDFSLWNAMNMSDRQNPRRLIRKIEIADYRSNKDIKKLRDKEKEKENTLIIGLTAAYPVLYERIDQRVEKRVQQGIVDEIKSLLEKGYSWELPSMNTFGYKEWKDYFILPHNSSLLPHAIQRWKWDEHGYARRQMTWFKNMKGIRWVDITSDTWNEQVEAMVASWYT